MTQRPSNLLGAGSAIIAPLKIIKHQIENSDFQVCYYEFQKDFFIDAQGNFNQTIEAELLKFTIFKLEDFCLQISLEATPFLMAIYHKEKIIRLHSPRLGLELFWLHNFEHKFIDNDFKDYVEKTIQLKAEGTPSVLEIVTQQQELDNLLDNDYSSEVTQKEETLRSEILVHLNSYKPSLFERVSDIGLSLSASYALIRIHLLKFLAMLPSLDYDTNGLEVKRVLVESLRRLLEDNQKSKESKLKGEMRALPRNWQLIFISLYWISQFIPASLLAKLIRFSVRKLGKRFIAGESISQSNEVLHHLGNTGRDVTLDQLGELVVSEKEADNYQNLVLELINGFEQHYKRGDKNSAGINKAHVSIKISALCSDFKAEAYEYTYNLIAPRLKRILICANEKSVYINIDAEHYSHRDTVFKIYKQVLLETEQLKTYEQTGIVLQAYLRDAAEHLNDILELANSRGIVMPIRLVKGAYWDAETIEATVHSDNAPQFLNKEETDIHFRQLIIKILTHNKLQLVLASHNFSDHCFAQALRDTHFVTSPRIEHQCLHMTYEALSVSLAQMGWAVRNYVPIGSLLVGMAYLVRRIMENSSQVGVLTIMRSHKKVKSLLHPREIHLDKKSKKMLEVDSNLRFTDEFFNVTPIKSYLEKELKPISASVKNFTLNKDYNSELSGKKISIFSQSDLSIEVGTIHFASSEDTQIAIERVTKAHTDQYWEKIGPKKRAAYLVKAANLMLLKRSALSSLIMYEAGKTLQEAYGDVDEAIDFLNFYARWAIELDEEGHIKEPRGPFAVITPWNFPLAIPVGMVSGPLVMGNPVLLKSAEQTPLIAQEFINLMHEVGVPEDVLIHLPGTGEEVGAALVTNSNIASVIFTGSKNVGTMIAKKCSERMYYNPVTERKYPTHVVTEMGGKNAIIVTASAELDETVAGILYSAFAHSGQKCSAASRVIVDNRVKPRLIERLKEACLDINVGSALDFGTTINPVISETEQKRLVRQATEATDEALQFGGRCLVNRTMWSGKEKCVGPAVFELPMHRAFEPKSFSQKELFGPIIHVIGFDDTAQAIEIFNATDYALTGGVFAQSQDDIDQLLPHLESGNLYLNRSITGARVGIEPFGGFKLSGTGPKAGHKTYLSKFRVTPFEASVLGEKKIAEEAGVTYDLDLCVASQLIERERFFRVLNLCKSIERNFESFYEGIYGDQKKDFKKFVQFYESTYFPFSTSTWKNHEIPGQDSYNKLDLKLDKVLLVTYEWRAFYSSLLEALNTLFNGSGLTVITRNQESYAWWSRFKSLATRNGISSANFDVYFVTVEILQKVLRKREYKRIIYDGPEEHLGFIQEQMNFLETSEWKHMLHLSCPQDSISPNDFESLVLSGIHMRAVANNTMRHGAPLDIKI